MRRRRKRNFKYRTNNILNTLKYKIKNTNHKTLIISIIFVLVLFFSIIFSLLNINNEKIYKNISILGIDVSNLTKEEAKNKITDIINEKVKKDIILKKDKYETIFNATQFDVNFNIDLAIDKAYNIGKDGNIITNNYGILFTTLFGKNLDCEFSYDEKSLEKKLREISSKLPGTFKDNSYYIEGDKLIIVKGTEGISIKIKELKDKIINKIKNVEEKNNIIQIPTEVIKPNKINLEKIRNEIYKEAQDAYISENPTTVHADITGIDFAISMEEAKQLLAENEKEYIIPLKITKPHITLKELGKEAFPNKLATYTTRYNPTNRNRSNNVELSTNKINGVILMPGEVFSYNKTVGERTISKGYKEAGAYAGGKVIQDVGGGVCQTSSTLYNVALLANLEIVDRTNHQFLTSYVPEGRDATVTWGGIDFKFKNTRKYPIKIIAKAKNGVCEMSIYGIEEKKEYKVEIQSVVKTYIPYTTKYEYDSNLKNGEEVIMQNGYKGCTCETYRILKSNGKIVSKTLLSKDSYDSLPMIIKEGKN